MSLHIPGCPDVSHLAQCPKSQVSNVPSHPRICVNDASDCTMVVERGLGGRLRLGHRVGPKGPPHLAPQGKLEPEGTRGCHGLLLATQAWEHVGSGACRYGQGPHNSPPRAGDSKRVRG